MRSADLFCVVSHFLIENDNDFACPSGDAPQGLANAMRFGRRNHKYADWQAAHYFIVLIEKDTTSLSAHSSALASEIEIRLMTPTDSSQPKNSRGGDQIKLPAQWQSALSPRRGQTLCIELLACNDWHSYCSNVKGIVNLEESPAKVVGHRDPPSDPLTITAADRIEDARAWNAAFRPLRIPKGVYRFRTHEEADEWLWQMLTRPQV